MVTTTNKKKSVNASSALLLFKISNDDGWSFNVNLWFIEWTTEVPFLGVVTQSLISHYCMFAEVKTHALCNGIW
jgi:hypothetical protein